MRKNFPVTGVEHEILDGQSIVSKTDTKGRITYVNPTFIEVSGFSEEELLGKAHNVVRHPDMPEQAFADLWNSLKSGIPWTGMVKNRCKNGDHYWVLANVAPMIEAGQIVGYMSVRTKPTRDQVKAAEDVYCRIREGDTRIAIRHGSAVRAGWTGGFAAIGNMSIDLRLALGMGFVIALLLLAGAIFGTSAGFFTLIGLAVAATGWLWRSLHVALVQPLRDATRLARAIAGGDLSVKVEISRNDDMGQLLRALQQMNVNLTAIVGDVRVNVDSISIGTGEIAGGNIDLSARTEQQAGALEEIASSMEELTSTVKQNADNAQQANQMAGSASEVANKGGMVVSQVVDMMGSINESSRKIVDIIAVIDGIAFQTNILALNAAVEAARAGEQGRGFAVVASEVRNLAQRSATAAKEIKMLIGDSVEKVNAGAKLVDRAGATMEEIVDSIKRVTGIMGEITAASREQTVGIEQINQAIIQMDTVTQQNAALVEEAAAAALNLEDQTNRLSQAVSVFKLTHGRSAPLVQARHSAKVSRLPQTGGAATAATRSVTPTAVRKLRCLSAKVPPAKLPAHKSVA